MTQENDISRRIITDGSRGMQSLLRHMSNAAVHLRVDESPKDYASRRDEVLSEYVTAIAEAVAGYDAFDVIELMRQMEVPFVLSGHRESEHEGLAAIIEIVTLVLLARGSRDPSTPGHEGPTPNHIVDELHRHASAILQVGAFSLLMDGDSEKYGPLTRLSSHYRSSELFVRYKQYAHIHDKFNEQLFDAGPNKRRIGECTWL